MARNVHHLKQLLFLCCLFSCELEIVVCAAFDCAENRPGQLRWWATWPAIPSSQLPGSSRPFLGVSPQCVRPCLPIHYRSAASPCEAWSDRCPLPLLWGDGSAATDAELVRCVMLLHVCAVKQDASFIKTLSRCGRARVGWERFIPRVRGELMWTTYKFNHAWYVSQSGSRMNSGSTDTIKDPRKAEPECTMEECRA